MDRRSFLKRTTGFTFALAAANLTLPSRVKCKMIRPVTGMVAGNFLDEWIKNNIRALKEKNPHLKIGDTHCHSTFSDGNYPVEDLIRRSAGLGLDFLIITEHVIPEKFPLELSLASFRERHRVFLEWNDKQTQPLTVYPAFETSTEQGHFILVFPEEYLKPKMRNEIHKRFSVLDAKILPMETVGKMGHAFGGISIIPHPNITRLTHPFGASIPFVKKHLTGLVDAVEDISTGHGFRENYSRTLDIASIGSSDDHFNLIIGTTVTGYDGSRHADFLSAVKARETQAIQVENSLTDFIQAARMVL